MPEKIIETSRRLGRGLADAGFGLVSCGWRGVDHIVARSFAEAVKETEGHLAERLTQFMDRARTPNFPAGRFVTGNSDREEWEQTIARAEAVILVEAPAEHMKQAKSLGVKASPCCPSRIRWMETFQMHIACILRSRILGVPNQSQV